MTKYGNLDNVVSWLAIGRGKNSRLKRAHGIYPSKGHAQAGWSGNLGPDEMVWTYEKDRAGLKIVHGGFWLSTPEVIKSREIWLQRYRKAIAAMNPRTKPTTVLTFARGKPKDALSHSTGRWNGPCALPAGRKWPMCDECQAPMAYVMTMDFRKAVGVAAPKASLVIHMCPKHWYEAKSTSLVWLKSRDKYRVVGEDHNVRPGTQWRLMDYDLRVSDDDPAYRFFKEERSLYLNFIAHGTKLGGLPNWIQNPEVPVDRKGNQMAFIGHCMGSSDVELGDAGCIYLFHSMATGETKPVMQCF
jgi:hypothetical protein